MDNSAAEAFCKNTCFKTNMKHIDCRQEWVQSIRNHDILYPTHVDTHDNLADIFTKILDETTFTRLRDLMMSDVPFNLDKTAAAFLVYPDVNLCTHKGNNYTQRSSRAG